MIGVVAALPIEARTLAEHRGSIRIRVAGVGAERAGIAARELVNEGSCGLVSWGLAGGLSDELRPGDVIMPERILDAAGATHPTSPAWRTRVAAVLPGSLVRRSGTLVEGTHVLQHTAEKAACHARTGATAVDLESAAIAAAAEQASLPFLAVRAIADPVELSLPRAALVAMGPRGDVRPLRCLAALARRPRDLLTLCSLWRATRNALRSLEHIARVCSTELFDEASAR